MKVKTFLQAALSLLLVLALCVLLVPVTGAPAVAAQGGSMNNSQSPAVSGGGTKSLTENAAPAEGQADDAPAGEGAGEGQETVNAASAWYLRTDGDMYHKDSQKIYITAGGGSGAVVKIFAETDAAREDPLVEYSVAENAGLRYTVKASDLGAGTFTAALFENAAAKKPRKQVSFTVVESGIYTSKAAYKQDEEIVFRFFADVATDNDMWFALYKSSDEDGRTYGGDYIQNAYKYTGYYWRAYICGVAYTIGDELGIKSLQPGSYDLVLFGDSGYNDPVSVAKFAVEYGAAGEAYAPSYVYYSADDLTNGTLSGTVQLAFAPGRMNADAVVAYWADENGRLEGYAPFGEQYVTGQIMNYYRLENVTAPEGATHLRFYGKNRNGLGSTYARLDLPEEYGFDRGEKITSFAVVSDNHVSPTQPRYTENFKKTLADIAEVIPGGSVFVNGDGIDGTAPDDEENDKIGPEVEWEYIESIVNGQQGLGEVYYALGNHDLYKNDKPGNWAQVVKPYQDVTGLTGSTVWYKAETDGVYHLILGSQESWGDKVSCVLKKDQLDWLESELTAIAAADPTAPVFVYVHQPLTDTTAGSLNGQGWAHVVAGDETYGEIRLKNILNEYPQAIMFNGHNHKDLDSYRVTCFASTELRINLLQTGGTAYIGNEYKDNTGAHQGWIVEVYENAVVCRGRDFLDKTWIPSAYLLFKV